MNDPEQVKYFLIDLYPDFKVIGRTIRSKFF